MFAVIKEHFETIFREDPAAKSRLEIVLCYPGFHAILTLQRTLPRTLSRTFYRPTHADPVPRLSSASLRRTAIELRKSTPARVDPDALRIGGRWKPDPDPGLIGIPSGSHPGLIGFSLPDSSHPNTSSHTSSYTLSRKAPTKSATKFAIKCSTKCWTKCGAEHLAQPLLGSAASRLPRAAQR